MNTRHADNHTTEAGPKRARTSGARRTKTGLAAALVILGTFAGLTVAGVTPASASTLNGVATIVDPNGLAPLTSGASTDQFTVSLPANAACDGDTASGGYHVYSYLQPEGTNPTGVLFNTGVPSSYYGLLSSTGRYYGTANTAATTGEIIGIPNDLEFAPLLSKGISLDTLLYSDGNTSGVWEAGIACANASGVVTDYWNTEVTFTADGTDPNGFVWSDVAGPCAADATVAFNSAATVTFPQRSPNAFTASASGCPDPTYSETGPLPNGVTFASSGLLTGNPTQSGSFPLTLSAAIGAGTPVTQSFTLTVPVTSPYAPTIGSVTGGNAQATVNFSGPSNNGGAAVTSYKVTATDNTSASGNQTKTGTASPITVTGLTNGDNYTFTVAAINSVGTGPASGSSAAVVPATVPDAPVIGTASAGNTQAAVTFSPPDTDGGSAITSYIATATDTDNPAGDQSQSGTSPITVSGLINGDSYTLSVTATNSVGTGAASASSNTVVPAPVPDAPAAPTATAGNASATVNWSAPSDSGAPVSGYVVTPYIGATAQPPVDVGNVLSTVVAGLANGTTYTFTVAATNSAGTGLSSPPSNAVTPIADRPGAPTAVTPTAGKGSVKLTWKAPVNNGGAAITHYVIRPSTGSAVTVGDVTTATVTGLKNGTAYTFTVAATNSSGTGAASAKSKSVTPDGLYVTTKSLPKATRGKKYATVKLAEKNGVGTETWTATGLPTGLKVTSAGVLSGTVGKSDTAKTYSVTVAVKDSSKPTKQSASVKLSLVVAS
jgi:Fibronectin type III domain/Putative Ig domain